MALDSKALQPNMSTILYNLLNIAEQCKNKIKKNKVLPSSDNVPCHKVAHFLWLNEAIWGKHWEEDFRLSRAIVPTSRTILYRKVGNHLLTPRQNYGLTVQHVHKILYRSMFDTHQQVDYSLKNKTAHCMESWCQCIVIMYFKKVSSHSVNSNPVTWLWNWCQMQK